MISLSTSWVLVTPAGFYLDDLDGWTTERAAARLFTSRTCALRMKGAIHRREGVELRIDGPAAERRQEPLSPAQRFALELAQRYGALRCAGDHWTPAGQTGPRVSAATVHSLVRRGELAVTAEGTGDRRHGRLRWRRRWQEVAVRSTAAGAGERQQVAA